MVSKLEKTFHLTERGSTVKTEVYAGFTTFFAMAYIIFVNPAMLSYGNEQIFDGVFFATCISAAIGTLLMAFLANLPFAQAPGMGLNALFAFTAMPALAAMAGDPEMDLVKQYQMALCLVLISGIIFIVITVLGLREQIISAIPNNIKLSISAGIGFFIAFLGLQNAGIVVSSPATLVDLVNFTDYAASASAALALFGLMLLAVLSCLKINGAILISIVATTVLSYLVGHSVMPSDFSMNIATQGQNFMDVSLFKMDFVSIFASGNVTATLSSLFVLIVSMSLVDMFDSIGTFIGTASKANLLDKDGQMPAMRKALMCDAIATTAGACLGTSTVTTYVESAAGVYEGGKTGMTSLVTGALFLVALVFAPFIGLVPACATAPALIYVGYLMITSIGKVELDDISEGLPAFLTIAMMPLTYSIANGIGFGLISYVIIKACTGKMKEIKPATWVITALFLVKYVVPM
ncbi:MAG: NCS2 family permease [Eubacteriales bacterium]